MADNAMGNLLASPGPVLGPNDLLVSGHFYGVRYVSPQSIQSGTFWTALQRLGINPKNDLEDWNVAQSPNPNPGWSVIFAFTVDNPEQCNGVRGRFFAAAQAAGIGEPAWCWICDGNEQNGTLGAISESMESARDQIEGSVDSVPQIASNVAQGLGETAGAIQSYLFWSLILGGAVVGYLWYKGMLA